MKKHIVITITFLTLFLAACDSSSPSPTSGVLIQDDEPLEDNGLSDEVQLAILDRYPDNESTRNALTQFALGVQESLVATVGNNENQINDAFQEVIDAADCMTAASSNSLEDIIFIEALMIDSTEKSQAYEEFNTLASGQFFGGSTNFEDGCR